MTVKELTALCASLTREQASYGSVDLLHSGLQCGKKIMVNGRVLESGDSYSAVTIEYLAKGMQGYFTNQVSKMAIFKPVERPREGHPRPEHCSQPPQWHRRRPAV